RRLPRRRPGSGAHRGEDRLGLLSGQKLSENILKNAAVQVIQQLLRRVDADRRAEFFGPAVFVRGLYRDLATAGEASGYGLSESEHGEGFAAAQAQRFDAFAVPELERKDAHPDQIGAVDALVAFGEDESDSLQVRPFGRPVAGRAR